MENQSFYRVAASDLILREEAGEATVEGMVVPYGEWSEVDSIIEGHFIERFSPGSLTKSFSEAFKSVKGYFEHGRSRLFDRAPVMDIQRTWETDEGAFFSATLLKGLPEFVMDGIRRGVYGASLGAKEVNTDRVRFPGKSDYNPLGIEERTYRELRANDISLTPRPHYANAQVVMRSITDELAIEDLLKDKTRFIELLREVQEAEPEHPQPEEPEVSEEQETIPVPEPEPEPEPEGGRATPSPVDYFADETEEEWRL